LEEEVSADQATPDETSIPDVVGKIKRGQGLKSNKEKGGKRPIFS